MSINDLKSMASGKLGFARTNQFAVQLPSEFAGGNLLSSITSFALTGQMGGGDLNILCTQASLPGKQVLVQDRRIGMEYQKVANGYAVDDVSLTFYVLNDYGIKDYFDNWYGSVVIDDFSVAPYKSEYARDIKILQLRRPITSKSFNVGPINIGADIGGGTAYACQLIDAFPTTIQAIDLSNELDGLVQLTVQLSYTNWKPASTGFLGGLIAPNFGVNLGSGIGSSLGRLL
tara:strand:- start:6925 stop:7617 length:693 start_codon:yes stop_codon:yes gene_type:complete